MLLIAVESGKEAIIYIEQQKVEIAILGMQVPAMDGLTIADKVRDLPNYKRLPLIMLSSIGNVQSYENSQEVNLDFTAYLSKPMKKSQLLKILINIFSKDNISASTQSKFDHLMADKLPLKIIVAEDNVVNQKVVINILQSLGYHADLVANGLEVLPALRRQAYNVILMDLQMREMDGLTATRQICQEWP
jgi:CheY-like chemotaxis protein